MRVIFKVWGLLLTGAGAFLVQNSPAALRDNICSWDFVKPCPDWFDSAVVNQAVFFSLVAIGSLFLLSLIIPALAENYKRTVTDVALLFPQNAPLIDDNGPVYWELTQALSWIAFGEPKAAAQWAAIVRAEGLPITPQEERDKFDEAEQALFEAFRAKKLSAKGKRNQSEVYEDIPPDYFLSNVACQILHNVIDVNQERGTATFHWDGPKWRDVQIEREAILKLWPSKAKSAIDRPVAQHDWNLSQAYQYWARVTNEQGRFPHELEQAAYTGTVTVWGKRRFQDNAIMETVPKTHWVKSCIDMHPVIYSDTTGVSEDYILENSMTTPRRQHDPNDFEYWKLKVTSEEIKKLWPAGNI